jgi:hypothetical protein
VGCKRLSEAIQTADALFRLRGWYSTEQINPEKVL